MVEIYRGEVNIQDFHRHLGEHTSCLFCHCCVGYPCFVLLSILTIPSDEQSKKWQKLFIYITSFSVVLINAFSKLVDDA